MGAEDDDALGPGQGARPVGEFRGPQAVIQQRRGAVAEEERGHAIDARPTHSLVTRLDIHEE